MSELKKGWGVVVFALSLALAGTVTAQTPRLDSAASKIETDLRETLAEQHADVPVFVLLRRQADLDPTSWRREPKFEKNAWRRSVIERLRSLAEESQDGLLAKLETAGHDAELSGRWWIVNGLALRLDESGIEWLAAAPEVARIYLRTEKPADLIATEGKYTRAFQQPPGEIVTVEELLAHDDMPWNLKAIQADLVWSRLGLLGRGVVVALMDSGVNYRHEDFRYHLWRNEDEIERNLIDDDGNGYVDDIYGFNFANGNGNIEDDFFHGNTSASVMVGDGRSGMLTGVAPGAQLMTLRIYDQRTRHDNHSLWQAFQYDAFEAFQYAVVEGADVINMSVSWEPAEKPLDAAWRYAATNVAACGVVIVAGSGNWRGSYPMPEQIRPPASVPAVMATGGILPSGELPPLSSRGPVTWSEHPPFDDYPLPAGVPNVVALSAPWGDFPSVHFRLRGYEVLTGQAGSSLTSPHVAGVVALMLEQEPQLMADEIRRRLVESSRDIGEMGTDPYTGAGLVQAFDAITLGSVPLPRLTGVRFLPVDETAPAETLLPGTALLVELDLANPGAPDPTVVAHLSATIPGVTFAEGEGMAVSLGKRETLRFHGDISEDAVPGSQLPLTLELDLSHAGKRRLGFELPIWGTKLLLVDDDGGGFYERAWIESLERLGAPFDLLSLWPAPRAPLPPDLHRYATIIWLTGEEAYDSISAAQQELLLRYSKHGRLIVAGQNLARDLAGSEMLQSLGVRFVQDSVRPKRLTGKDHSILAGLDVPYTTGATLPDAIAALPGASLVLPVEEPADSGVAVSTDHGLTITVEIAGIGDLADRDSLICRLLEGSCPRPSPPPSQ